MQNLIYFTHSKERLPCWKWICHPRKMNNFFSGVLINTCFDAIYSKNILVLVPIGKVAKN